MEQDIRNTAMERVERIIRTFDKLGTENILKEIGDKLFEGDFKGKIQLELQTKTEEELVEALEMTGKYNMEPKVSADGQELYTTAMKRKRLILWKSGLLKEGGSLRLRAGMTK